MKTNKFKILICIFLIVGITDNSYSQFFTDNYSSSSGWTKYDDFNNTLNIQSGYLQNNTYYYSPFENQSRARIVRSLDGYLKNSNFFKANITYTIVSSDYSVAMTILALSNLSDPSYLTHNNSNLVCNKNTSITLRGGHPNILYLQIKSDSLTSNGTDCPNGESILFSPSTPIGQVNYLTLIKSNNLYRLSIYIDSNRTNKIFDTLLKSRVTTGQLNYVQHGNHASGGYERTMTMKIQKLLIDSSRIILSNASIQGSAKIEMNLYPNPIKDVVYIESKSIFNQNIIFSMYNMEGKLVTSKSLFSASSKISVPLNNMNPGIYTIMLEVNGDQAFKKVLIK